MTPADTAELLALAAAFDNRSISEVAARAWSEALDERVALDDAKRAIVEHYAATREWVMPSDVNGWSDRVRARRLEHMETPQPPADLEVVDELTWQRAYRRAVGDGYDEQTADQIACDAAGVTRRPSITSARPVMALVQQAADSLPRIPTHAGTTP